MSTKQELEVQVVFLQRKVSRLENATPKMVEKIVEVEKVVEKMVQAPASPKPSVTEQRSVQSHPILGIISKEVVTENSIGDGRIGDGATIVRT